MSDQHNSEFSGSAAQSWVRTPALDALSADGTSYTDCYCPAPLCGPARMSFLTGLMPYQTGIYANGQCLSSDIPTFAHGKKRQMEI
ncbi:MAG: sulfatase-like hydrolase/transferase [Planctomycetota bacterium]